MINNNTLKQVSRFKYLGNSVVSENDNGIKNKINRFREACGAMHRDIRQEVTDTRIKIYMPVA